MMENGVDAELISDEVTPEKRRRVYRCADGTYVKVHAVPASVAFGRLYWTMSGSHCDESGRALMANGATKIHHEKEGCGIQSDAPVDIRQAFDAACLVVVERVRIAVAHEQALAF